MTVGRSNITPYKQSCYKHILKENIFKSNCVWDKHDFDATDRIYHLFDLTAGDANPKIKNSPFIGLETLYDSDGLNFKYYLTEKTKSDFVSLNNNVADWIEAIKIEDERLYFNENVHRLYGTFQKQLPQLLERMKWKFGMLYFDSNGCGGINDWDFITRTSWKWNTLEILINIQLNALKRCYKSTHPAHEPFNKLPSELLSEIDKRIWWVREFVSNDTLRWVMFFGTNMEKYNLNRIDFHRVTDLNNSYIINDFDNFVRRNKDENSTN
jgi:hypothetical protein